MNYLEQLAKCELFSSMNATEIAKSLEQVGAREFHFAKGEILAMQDEICNRLIILTSGSVKAEMFEPSGRVVKIEDITAPNPLAILFIFGPKNRFPVQVTAHEKVSAVVIPKPSLLKMLHTNEQLLNNYLDISAIYASRLREKLHLMSFRTIRQKLAIYFIEQMKRSNNDTITLDRTLTSLAEYFGVSRPSLSRELSKMQQDKLIEQDKTKITILNKNTLIQLIQFG